MCIKGGGMVFIYVYLKDKITQDSDWFYKKINSTSKHVKHSKCAE